MRKHLLTFSVSALMALSGSALAQTAAPNASMQLLAHTTHCLAVGQAFQAKTVEVDEKISQFHALFPNPSDSEKALLGQLTDLRTSFKQAADLLKSRYYGAPAPSQADIDAAIALSPHDRLTEVKTCI